MRTPDPDPSASPPRVLPRGRHAAPREIVWRSQRERMLEAIAVSVAEKGYGNTAVADVIDRAGVSRKTFYEHFPNKEACFLAAYDAGVERLMRAIEDEVRRAAPDWLGATVAGIRCHLETLAQNPAFARTFLVEVLAAGPDALERRTEVHERFARLLAEIQRAARADVPALPDLGPHVFRACVGAINELATEEVLKGRVDRLPELEPAALDVVGGLLVGHQLWRELRARAGDGGSRS
jgi:AcrR family transcriptional regulator